jgi:hypothetical protein
MTVSLDHVVEMTRNPTKGLALLVRSVAASCALLWVAACATDNAPRGSQFVISTPSAAFYKNGPAEQFDFAQHTFANYITEQQVGPDFRLPKGTHLTMVKREFGYSRVMTDNGVAGYVANEELQAAPAPAVAQTAPTNTRTGRSYRERVRNNNNAPAHRPSDQLDLNDLPLPLPG